MLSWFSLECKAISFFHYLRNLSYHIITYPIIVLALCTNLLAPRSDRGSNTHYFEYILSCVKIHSIPSFSISQAFRDTSINTTGDEATPPSLVPSRQRQYDQYNLHINISPTVRVAVRSHTCMSYLMHCKGLHMCSHKYIVCTEGNVAMNVSSMGATR